MLPPWLETWWREFGSDEELYLVAIREGEDIPGVAPLFLKGAKAQFIGSPDVCDYSDFILSPGREIDFFNSLLDELKERGTKELDLRSLRPDSKTLIHLPGVARGRGWRCLCEPEDTSLELYLPPKWEAYLEMLNQKQRHEVRRKLRRIEATGNLQFRVLEYPGAFADGMAIFLKMFRESREDKAAFMSPQRESFFCSLVEAMARVHLIKFGILELSGTPIAAILFFDYNNVVYLYNSGYDLHYRSLSVGFVSKVLCIKDSIERNKAKFDFLKGDEIYKHRLGGKPIPLYRCNVSIE
jgi:CelD/BcsL family acetyltransferase involved in cellulose biosynthesis